MAMTAAFTENNSLRANAGFGIMFTITISGTYTTGGDVIDFATVDPKPTSLAGKQPFFVSAIGQLGYTYLYDYTNKKLKVFQCAGAGAPQAEVANGSSAHNADIVRALVCFAKA